MAIAVARGIECAHGVGLIYDGPGAGTHEVHGCIYQYYAEAMGGPDGPLGFPISDPYATPEGSVSDFQYGSISEVRPTDHIQARLAGDTLATVLNRRDRSLEVFAWTGDGTLAHNARSGADGRWSGWRSLDANPDLLTYPSAELSGSQAAMA